MTDPKPAPSTKNGAQNSAKASEPQIGRSPSESADEQVARELGALFRQEQQLDDLEQAERWAAGAPPQPRERRGVLAKPGAEQVFSPWAPEDAAQLAASLGKLMSADAAESLEANSPPGLATASPSASAGRSEQDAPISLAAHRSSRRSWLLGAGAGAVAAAAAWLVVPRGSLELPEYGVQLSAGDQLVRSEADGPAQAGVHPRFRADSRFELQLQPAEPVSDPVNALLAFRSAESDTWRRVKPHAEIAASGAVRFVGTADDLFAGTRGSLELMAVVSAGSLPELDEAATLSAGKQGAVTVFRRRIEVTDR